MEEGHCSKEASLQPGGEDSLLCCQKKAPRARDLVEGGKASGSDVPMWEPSRNPAPARAKGWGVRWTKADANDAKKKIQRVVQKGKNAMVEEPFCYLITQRGREKG